MSNPDYSIVRITVTGTPVPKGRGKVSVFNGRVNVRTPQKTRRWEDDARNIAREAMKGREIILGPVCVTVKATFAPTPSWPAWKQQAALGGWIAHTSKPDEDNLGKAAKDAMNGIVYRDDSQISESCVIKTYSLNPSVEICVEPFTQMSARVSAKRDYDAFTTANGGRE